MPATRSTFLLFLGLWACDGGSEATDPVDGSSTGEGTAAEDLPTAPLAPLSDGECPDMSGLSTFSSAGLERKVKIIQPANGGEGMPLIFAFHGLVSPDMNPISTVVDGFGLKNLADELGAVIVAPEARVTDLPMVGEFNLWGILGDELEDLVLYDDLRTCVGENLDVDLMRVSAFGHSGGALWTSMLAIERADTLSSVVEFSGGASLTIPLLGGPFIPYMTPASPVPALLFTGGPEDVWPDQTLTLVDFEAATDSLQEGLVGDGSLVVRCKHTQGHFSIPFDAMDLATPWLEQHVFEQPSPFEGGDGLLEYCELQ
jgi:poly(3-hydroxybutyrate) depolymerase